MRKPNVKSQTDSNLVFILPCREMTKIQEDLEMIHKSTSLFLVFLSSSDAQLLGMCKLDSKYQLDSLADTGNLIIENQQVACSRFLPQLVDSPMASSSLIVLVCNKSFLLPSSHRVIWLKGLLKTSFEILSWIAVFKNDF